MYRSLLSGSWSAVLMTAALVSHAEAEPVEAIDYLREYWSRIETVRLEFYMERELPRGMGTEQRSGAVFWSTDNSKGWSSLSELLAIDGSGEVLVGQVVRGFVGDVTESAQYTPRLNGTYDVSAIRNIRRQRLRFFQGDTGVLLYFHSICRPVVTWHEVVSGEQKVTLALQPGEDREGLVQIHVVPVAAERLWEAVVRVDPNRGHLPVEQQTIWHVPNGQVDTVRVVAAEEMIPGLWYPTSLHRVQQSKWVEDDGSVSEEEYRWETSVAFAHVELNTQLSEAECKVAFPVGTRVLDRTNGDVIYTVEHRVGEADEEARRTPGVDFEDSSQRRLVEAKLRETTESAAAFRITDEESGEGLSGSKALCPSRAWLVWGWGLIGAILGGIIMAFLSFRLGFVSFRRFRRCA